MGCSQRSRDWTSTGFALAASLALAACGGGRGGAGPAGPSGSPSLPIVIGDYDPLPGVVLDITSVTGGSGAGGALLVGDLVTVHFTAKTNDGTALDIPSLVNGQIYLSGPSNNYQRVLLPQDDVATRSVYAGGGVWSYTFAAPIPALYPPPVNDTTAFGIDDGELQGTALLDGTYTVGLETSWMYWSNGKEFLDTGTQTFDILFGSAVAPSHREVVANANCNVCHTELRVHDGKRKDVRLCVLCHTAGAEDSNVGLATPGVTIEFKVMVHRIHNGSHLPSVQGVSTAADGSRLYPTGPPGNPGTPAGNVVNFPKRLLFVDGGGVTKDFTDVNFPVFPNFQTAMPKDLGYSALSAQAPTIPVGYTGPTLRTQKSCEDTIRTGVTACDKCHGDPDKGLELNGPLLPPAQGGLCYTQPSMQACGACHDDIDWTKPYTANGATMPIQAANGGCILCHTSPEFAVPGPLPTRDVHVHPMNDPVLDPGVNLVVTDVLGGSGGSGVFVNGDSPQLKFTLKNDAGSNLGLATMDSGTAFFLGNTVSRQFVMPFTSVNGMTVNPFDFVGRFQSPGGTGKGATMSKIFLGSPQVAGVLVVEFNTSSTHYTVNHRDSAGTVVTLGTGDMPAATSTGIPSGGTLTDFDIDPTLGSSSGTSTVQVTFTDATHFTVSGAVSGTGVLPNNISGSMRFNTAIPPKLAFNVTVGGTPFAAGSQFQISLFKGGPANPVRFAIVGGTTAFAFTPPASDRFYFEEVPDAVGPDFKYTANIPMDMQLEYLGLGTGVVGQQLFAGNTTVYYGRQQLWQATAGAPTATMATGVNALARQVDVTPLTGFAAGDTVVVDSAAGVGLREYVTITPVKADGTAAGSGDTTVKIIFRTPLRYAHTAVTISKVTTLALKQEGAANGYTLDPASGTITSVTAFPLNAAMVMTYRTEARFGYFRDKLDTRQTVYVPPANDTVAIGQEQGDWQGLPYLPGTYTADIWVYKSLDVGLQNELQVYRSTSFAGTKDFQYVLAGPPVPHDIISSSANCNTCHTDIMFHGGGRRGVDACVTCHSTSGSTDNILAPPSVAIEFRQMLHKIHMGSALPGASAVPPYPHSTKGTFPAMPGAVMQCVRCHGNEAWKQPSLRVHPSASVPVRVWGDVCGSCHDSTGAHAHIDVNTPGGIEACETCHGPAKDYDVVKVHLPR